MEKRTIQITIEQAREWYRSENQTLKTLALSAFTEAELELTMDEIFNKVGYVGIHIVANSKSSNALIISSYLSLLAEYFNSQCVTPPTQHFIKGKYEGEIQFGSHSGVRYPGIVYFNRLEDLKKAIKLIGEDIKYLFE